MAYSTRYTNPNTWTFPGGWQYQQQQQPQSLPANSAQARQEPQGQGVTPFDAGLTNAYNTADLNYGNTLASLSAQQPIIQRQFGYTDDGQIDPNNPFSKAQLLQRAYQQTQTGTRNQMAGRGQLYSGANQRAQNDNQFNYQAQDAQLRGTYAQQLAELARLRGDAMNTRNNSRSGAYWDWVMGQIQNRAASPVDPNGGGQPGPAPGPGPVPGGNVLPYDDPTIMPAGPQTPYDIPFAPNSPVSPEAQGAAGLGGYVGTPVEQYLRALYAAQQGVNAAAAAVSGGRR